jgi:hypothetical protein
MQSNFTSGELDPKLLGRVDLAVYYNAARQARNVTPLVQGGMSRRDGSELIDEKSAPTIDRVFSFQFSTTDAYLLGFADSRMYIYKDGDTLQTNINGSGNDYLVIPYTAAQIPDLDIVQSADTVIVVHPDEAPRKIVRTSDTDWAISLLAITNTPQYDFDDASSPTPVSEIQVITFANQNTSDRYRLGLEGILTEDIIFSNDSATNAESIRIALQDLPNTANSGVSVVDNSITEYTVTFADSAADDWDLLTGTPVNTELVTFEISTSETQAGTSRSEDVWSAGRGYPRTVTFHESRLYFGGSKSRPQTLWGSVVNDFFNFNKGRAREDESIDVTLDTDQVNAIQAVFSNRALQIFTTGQEFYVPQSPITPEGIAVIPQTNFGSKKVRPITIDGRTLYIQRTGKAVREFVQSSDVTNIYNSNSITLLASHIVLNPSRMAASRGSTEVDANYAYLVNSDGTLLVYNVLGAEGIIGFTLWTLETFTFVDVAVVNDEVFALVVDGSSSYIVRMNSDRVTDIGVKKATPANGIFTGLDHLEGMTVDIVGDGAFDGTAVVSGGQVTVDADHTNTECGLRFTPIIETMPLNIPLQNGPNFSEPKKINRVTIDYFESLGMIVSNSVGQSARIADKTMAVDVFDNPTPQTGRKDIWLLGWDNVATVTITQEEPVPMTILSIAVEVGVQ